MCTQKEQKTCSCYTWLLSAVVQDVGVFLWPKHVDTARLSAASLQEIQYVCYSCCEPKDQRFLVEFTFFSWLPFSSSTRKFEVHFQMSALHLLVGDVWLHCNRWPSLHPVTYSDVQTLNPRGQRNWLISGWSFYTPLALSWNLWSRLAVQHPLPWWRTTARTSRVARQTQTG